VITVHRFNCNITLWIKLYCTPSDNEPYNQSVELWERFVTGSHTQTDHATYVATGRCTLRCVLKITANAKIVAISSGNNMNGTKLIRCKRVVVVVGNCTRAMCVRARRYQCSSTESAHSPPQRLYIPGQFVLGTAQNDVAVWLCILYYCCLMLKTGVRLTEVNDNITTFANELCIDCSVVCLSCLSIFTILLPPWWINDIYDVAIWSAT